MIMADGKIDFTLDKITGFIDYINSARDEIRGKRSSFESAYNSARRYLEGNIRVFENNLNVCDEEREVASDNKEQIETAVDNVRAKKENLEKVRDKAEDELSQIQSDKSKAQDAVSKCDNQKPVKGTGEGAEEAYNRAKSEWEAVRRDLVARRDQLQREYSQVDNAIKDLQRKISDCSNAIGKLKELLRELNDVISDLDGEHRKLSECKKSFEEALENLTDRWQDYVEGYNSAVQKLGTIAEKAEIALTEAEQIAVSVSELTGDRVRDNERLAFVNPDYIADGARELINCANAVSRQSNIASEFTYNYNNQLQDGVIEEIAATVDDVNGYVEDLGARFAKIGRSLEELSQACNRYLDTALNKS